MAARWVDVLGLAGLEAKLDSSIENWLHSGRTAPARHSTMRATLEWSYDLLSAEEQAVVRRLAVFAGSFTMPAAEFVVQDGAVPKERVFEHVGSLIRKSMIALVPGPSGPYYRQLETTRAFMLEKLAASPDGAAQWRKHAAYVLHALETVHEDWETMNAAAWTERYGDRLDDLRGALDWAMRESSDDAVALACVSWPLWRELSLGVEGKEWLSAAAALLRADTPPAMEAQLRHGLGELLWPSARAACAEFARAVAIYRSLGEVPRLGLALARLGFALLMSDRVDEAQLAVAESMDLLTRTPSPRMLATAYSTKMCVEARLGRFDVAREAAQKALSLCELIGARRMAFVVTANLVEMLFESGDLDGAIELGGSLSNRLLDTPHSDLRGFVLAMRSGALTARGDIDDALAAAREAAPLLRDEGELFWLFDHLALRAGLAGRMTDAALLAGYADAACRTFEHMREPVGRHAMEHLSLLLRDALPDGDMAELSRLGEQLSEDQAIALALGACRPG
jgi:tetratricopeptide (TPR) repeat protein